MMTTVPFMGQHTNGVSVTRINMVTTSNPVVNIKIPPTFRAPIQGQAPITKQGADCHPKYTLITIDTKGL